MDNDEKKVSQEAEKFLDDYLKNLHNRIIDEAFKSKLRESREVNNIDVDDVLKSINNIQNQTRVLYKESSSRNLPTLYILSILGILFFSLGLSGYFYFVERSAPAVSLSIMFSLITSIAGALVTSFIAFGQYAKTKDRLSLEEVAQMSETYAPAFELVDPRMEIIETWASLELALQRLVSDENNKLRRGTRGLITSAVEKGFVSSTELEEVYRFLNVRNKIAHGDLSPRNFSPSETKNMINEMKSIINRLSEIKTE